VKATATRVPVPRLAGDERGACYYCYHATLPARGAVACGGEPRAQASVPVLVGNSAKDGRGVHAYGRLFSVEWDGRAVPCRRCGVKKAGLLSLSVGHPVAVGNWA
jgi:hypothetical protein